MEMLVRTMAARMIAEKRSYLEKGEHGVGAGTTSFL